MQQARPPGGGSRTGLQSRGQCGGMGREPPPQLTAQGRLAPPEAVEGIGAGGIVGEAPQQPAPEAIGTPALAQGFGGAGIKLQHQGGERVGPPALVAEQLALTRQIMAGARLQQQGGLAAAHRIGITTPDRHQGGAVVQGGE